MMLAEGCDRTLSNEDMEVYRAPWKDPAASREAILSFVRSVPVVDCGDDAMPASPQAVVDAVIKYSMWLKDTKFAKLLIITEPGAIFAKGSEPLFFSRYDYVQYGAHWYRVWYGLGMVRVEQMIGRRDPGIVQLAQG